MIKLRIAPTLLCLLFANSNFANSTNWSGITDSNWSTNSNWFANPPTSQADLTFGSAIPNFISNYDVPLGLIVNSMTIATDGRARYQISGTALNPIDMGSTNPTITNSGMAGTPKFPILNYLQINGATTITNQASAPLSIPSSYTQINHSSGMMDLTLNNLGLPGQGGFYLSQNSFQGQTSLGSGSFFLADSSALGGGKFTMIGLTTLHPLASMTLINNLTVSGVITTDTNNILTLTGTIDGGQLSKNGPGTLILTNANNYTGGTTVRLGTLSVSTPANISSGLVTLSGGSLQITAPFVAANLFEVTADSTITSTDTTLTGTLTGSDATILSLMGSNSLSTVVVNGTDNFTIQGPIGGTTLTKNGTGNLILSSANTYTSGTSILNGTLSVSSPSNIGVGKVSLDGGFLQLTAPFVAANPFAVTADGAIISTDTTLNGTLTGSDATTLSLVGSNSLSSVVVNGTDHFIINGPIGNGVPLTKTGNGILELVGASNNAGAVSVTQGRLAVNGSLTSTSVTVGSGASLSGTGTITANVNNSGTLAPGASIGTLTIVGNYTQNGGTFENEINPSSSDKLIVHGNMIIGSGTTFALIPDTGSGSYANGTTYTVIDTSGFGTVTGSFSNFTTTSPLVAGTLSYPGTQVILTLSMNSIAQTVAGGNAGAVALALDAIGTSANPAVTGIINSFSTLNEAQLISALNQLQPSLYKGAAIVQENNSTMVNGALGQRLQVVLDREHCFFQKSESTEQNACNGKNRDMHLWLTGVGDFLHQGATTFHQSPQVGYQGNSCGFVTGVDYNFLSNFYLGAIGGYTHSNLKWQENQGHGDIDSGYAGLYVSAIGKLFYGNLSVIGAWNEYSEKRSIVYPGINETAANSHHGKQIISHLDTGINLGIKGFSIRPFDSFDWIIQNENAFTESDAGAYNLDVDKSHANLLRNELGVNLAACHCFNNAQAIIDTKLGWVREVRVSGESYDAEFVGTDVPFTVVGYFPNRNLLSVGASITATALKDMLTFTVYYEGAFGKKYSDNGLGGQINFGF